jgi:hypothetical protein
VPQKKHTDPAVAHVAEAAASRKRLEDAKAQASTDQQSHREAVSHLAHVTSSRTSTTDDLLHAEAAVRLIEQHMAGSAAAVAKAERALVNTSTDLAEAVVPFVEDVLGIRPRVQAFHPTEPQPVPSAVIVQTKAATLDRRSGSLSGSVEVSFTRERLHREMEAAAFQRHAERHGGPTVRAHDGFASEVDGTFTERVRLNVAGVFPALPTVEPGGETEGIRNLCADVLSSVDTRTDGYDADRGQRRRLVALDSTARAVVSDKLTRQERCTVVEVTFVGSPTYTDPVSRLSLDVIREEVERAARGLVGRAVETLGRVASVSIESSAVVERAGVARASHVVVLGSTSGVQVDGIAVRVRFDVRSAVPAGASLPAPQGSKPSASSVPSQRLGQDVREHLDDSGADRREHPGVSR